MNFEVLKRSHVKRNILIGVIIVLILSAIILTFTRAKYKITKSLPLVNGTINYELSDFNLIGAYIQTEGDNYTQVDEIPTSGYEFNSEKSYCTVNDENINVTLSYDMETQNLTITPLTTKGTKCYLYFDVQVSAGDIILANEGDVEAIISKGTPDFSQIATTDEGMYAAEDDYGTSYYYRGAVNDNWVQFGTDSSGQPLYWRIIRINGDGTIRLIYNGTTTNQTGTGTIINNTTYSFNSSYAGNEFGGYMYTREQVHGLEISSDAKTQVDNWYSIHLVDETELLDGSTGFCGDREPSTSSSSSNGLGGTGSITTYYGGYIRLTTNKSPILTCTNESDLYTTSGSGQGNGALQYPIGLITADEVSMAGGVIHSFSNQSYYLCTDQAYWTMTPYYYYRSSRAHVFSVNYDGYFTDDYVNSHAGIRPVINLRADVTISSGDGSASNPYVIAT